jgi:pimeloyl-ACP methyl ester carboxylesterase
VDAITTTFREKIVTFGEHSALVGVLSIPAERLRDGPCVVLLNSGIVHRVGAHRNYVTFTRALAAAGIPALRFDLSGIGDSERHSSTLPLQETVRRDIGAAVDFVSAQQGTSNIVLAGLCSGAFDAFEYALTDKRVTGACMLDMPGPFRNWSHLAYRAADRALRPTSWANLVRRISSAMLNPATARPEKDASVAEPEIIFTPGVRGYMSRERMESDLDRLLERGVRLAFVFTGGVDQDYNHRLQFRLRFPRAAAHPLLITEFIPWSDHTFSTQAAREYVTGFVRDWVRGHVLQSRILPPHGAQSPVARQQVRKQAG